MWYLQIELLLIITCVSVGLGLVRHFMPKLSHYAVPFGSLAVLWYISERLALFIIVYIFAGYICCRILALYQHSLLMLLFALGATAPLFAARADAFGLQLPFLFVSIGIAFHTLRLIDAFYYSRFAGDCVRPIVFINYMLFLPVFTAGPVFRYRDFQHSFDNPLKLDCEAWVYVFKRVIRGLFKKVVIVAFLLEAFQWVTSYQKWYFSLAAIGLSYLILYFDLSGYSDTAIAYGRLIGYNVPENFKRPWRAPTFTLFWRSWHSTVSDWIRDHVFVLIGRRRISKGGSALIAFFVMVLMSLWHGFSLLFLIAGIYNGFWLALENLFSLTTIPRKTNKGVLILRCAAVNFLFAVNTLVFMLPPETVLRVLGGLAVW